MRSTHISGVWVGSLTFLVSSLLFVPAVFPATPANENAAPEAQAPAITEAERVIVTGSNIPTAQEVGPNPVLALNRDLIEKSGERQAAELLRNLPVANANGVPVSNNATGFTPGAASVSLRGFTPEATLLLIDGRRVAPYPLGQGGTLTFQDLFTIPLPAVQSIEILKDGASTTYGADAVAGVVNLKFWKDYRGAQLTLQYGNTFDKDAAIYSGDLLFGIGDDKISVSGDIFFYHHNALFNHDRGNSWLTPALSTNSSPENLQISRAAALPALNLPQDPIPNLNPITNPNLFATADGRTFLNAAGLAVVGNTDDSPAGVNNAGNMAKIDGIRKLTVVRDSTGAFLGLTPNNFFFERAPHLSDGLTAPSQLIYSQGRSSFFNYNAFAGSYPEQERYGGYASFNDKICDDILQVYGDFSYVRVTTHNELAPAATGNFFAKGFVTIAIPPQTNLNGTAPPNTPRFTGEPGSGPGGAFAPGENQTSVPPNAFNPFNPFNQILSGGSRARLAEFGDRLIDNSSDAFLATLGVKGDKLFDGNWGYDAGFRYSEIDNESSGRLTSAERYSRILNAADPIFDPSSSQFIGTTIPYNPFGDFRRPIAANAIPVAFATVHPKDVDISKLTELDLNIYTTELFKLPAGGVGLAFGGQFRRENIEQDPDSLETEGDIIGSGAANITHAGRKSYALYGELRVPLLSPEMGIPGLHSVEVTGAFRFEEFLNNSTNIMVPKVGIRWQPFDEQLTLRSTWGEGFLEPSLFELYGSPTSGFVPTRYNGVINLETANINVSNPNLPPEDSRTWTGGAVYTPKWVPWGTLTVSLDLWDIERRGIVIQTTAEETVHRFARGTLLPGEIVEIDPVEGGVSFVQTSFQQGGRQNARGADLGMQYQIQTEAGTFTFLSQWAYLDQFVFQATPDSPGPNVVARFTDATSSEGYYRWKGISRIDWTWHNIDLNLTWNYIGGFRELLKNALAEQGFAFASSFPNDAHEHWVHPTNFIDGQVSYSLIFAPPVEPQPVAGYSKDVRGVAGKDGRAVETTAAYSMPCWKTILNNSTITVGCNNMFGQDPPESPGQFHSSTLNYPGFTYDNLGRFWYVQFRKKF